MSKKMLVDALHPEEIRLVISNNGAIEEFEYQNSLRKSTKGNIYLAKVVRVEPSLQAAFIEYGGERQGFLPFAEIHPDYYQIPAADKERLLQQMIDDAKKEEEQEEDQAEEAAAITSVDGEAEGNPAEDAVQEQEQEEEKPRSRSSKSSSALQQYKIQEVIKKDQVILIQVVKEERSTKGATLSTYISLAGRYCVLMPNSTRSGGISRKVADNKEKKRMKGIISELVAGKLSSSLILRTAGAYKSKVEIKRDFTYLSKLWDNIRAHTLASKAPAFIHEEGNMMKRAIRDLYSNDIDEIIVEGNDAYKEIYSFMQMFMPKHVNRVKEHTDKTPVFSKYSKLEAQIASFYSPSVALPSGGYLVINQTEALVSVDVNSGRSNKERNIEGTALRTNIEAAAEVARQLRLRDLSGLVVIDFIDMSEGKHRRAVEAALNEAISKDRARVQTGRISSFGLLEMSRQRINQSFLEANTSICPHCDGRGRVRPVSASAIAVLRAVASEIEENNFEELQVSGSAALMFYLLNNKRTELLELEKAAGAKISLSVDEEAGADGFFMKQVRGVKKKHAPKALSAGDLPSYNVEEDEAVEEEEEIIPVRREARERSDNRNNREDRSKRRGNKRNWRKEEVSVSAEAAPSSVNEEVAVEVQPGGVSHESGFVASGDKKRNRRNKKRPGGGQDKAATAHPAMENTPADYDDFDKEMDERRQQNQSLLREIWKKFVD